MIIDGDHPILEELRIHREIFLTLYPDHSDTHGHIVLYWKYLQYGDGADLPTTGTIPVPGENWDCTMQTSVHYEDGFFTMLRRSIPACSVKSDPEG